MTPKDMADQVIEVLGDSDDHEAAALRAVAQTVVWLESQWNLESMHLWCAVNAAANGDLFFPYNFRDYRRITVYEQADYSRSAQTATAVSHLVRRRPEEVGLPHYASEDNISFGRTVGIPTGYSADFPGPVPAGFFLPLSSQATKAAHEDHPLRWETQVMKISTYPYADKPYTYELEGFYRTPYKVMIDQSTIVDIPLFDEANELIEAGALNRLASRTRDLELKKLSEMDFLSSLKVFMLNQEAKEYSDIEDMGPVYNGGLREPYTDYRPDRVKGG